MPGADDMFHSAIFAASERYNHWRQDKAVGHGLDAEQMMRYVTKPE